MVGNVGRGMTSPPLESIHGRQHRAWHDISAVVQHTRSDDVGCGMPSSPLGSTNGQTASGLACQHRPWTAGTVRRHRAWHDITALLQHTRSNDVGPGMTSLPLDGMHGRTTLGVAYHHRLRTSSHSRTASGEPCHHRPWTTNTVERRRAWHAIISFGQHKRSNYIGHGITSSPLE